MKKTLLSACMALALVGSACAPDDAKPAADVTAVAVADEGPTPDWIKVDAGVAAAVEVPDAVPEVPVVDTEDAIALGKAIYDGVMSHDYWPALGAFMLLLTMGFRFVEKRLPFFATDDGRVFALGIVTFGTTLGVAAMASTAPSWSLLSAVLVGTAAAMGGYTGVKKVVWPNIKKLIAKLF